MRQFLVFALLLGFPSLMLGGQKEYPLTLALLETKQSSHDGGVRQIALTSIVEASDGNTYEIERIPGAGRNFLSGMGEGMQANAGILTVTYSGCGMQPGTYQARWDKGRLKLLVHNSKGKPKEMTFSILSSCPTQPPDARTKVTISSNPASGEIELDGSFVGSTPSSIEVLPGEHTIKITKTGHKPWERKIRTTGGEVNVAAELEPN